MRILLIVHGHFNPNSGAEGSTIKLGEAYKKLGHKVQYYTLDDLPSRLPGLSKKLLFPEFVAQHISSLQKETPFDVVDASTGDAWVWGIIKNLRNKKQPLLATRIHNFEHTENKHILEENRDGNLALSWKYALYRGSILLWEVATSLKKSDLVFCLNRSDAKYVIDQIGVPSERVKISPNGLPEYCLGLPQDIKYEDHDKQIKIAQIGTYYYRKGYQYSVPALNQILRKYDHVSVSLLGTAWHKYPNADAIYADFSPDLRDRVNVVPKFEHRNLPNLLSNHHITLFPSLYEPFGKALIEAMACGLAPITTAADGPNEIVLDEHDSLVVPFHESKAIEQAIERLINDRNLLHKLRSNAYQTAQRYNWESIARERLMFYEQKLQAGKLAEKV